MTEALYHLDPYQKQFDARVLETRTVEDGFEVRLNRTAFYPVGGGQPSDLGTLGEARMLGARKDDGEVWHLVDVPFEPEIQQAFADIPTEEFLIQQVPADAS